MDLLLIGVTALSLALALTLGVVLLRLMREERVRSDARVALLAAAAAEEDVPDTADVHTGPGVQPQLDLAGGMFATYETPAPWNRRAAVAAGIAVLLVSAYAIAPRNVAPAGQRAPADAAPLELLSLRHTVTPDGLRITGLVQNPPGGAALAQVVATALVFAADGSLAASGRAGVDYAALAPGDESPFVIHVPVTGTVSRYRVGFRGRDGAVIAHVDRRAAGASARRDDLTGSEPWVP